MPASESMKRVSVVTTTFCSLILVACTTVETQSFRVVGNSNVDSAYIATDADFSKYNRLLVDDMGIFFPEGVPMSEEELERIRQIFREFFMKELSEYEITQEPGPGMLRVTASLVDLRSAIHGEVPNLRFLRHRSTYQSRLATCDRRRRTMGLSRADYRPRRSHRSRQSSQCR